MRSRLEGRVAAFLDSIPGASWRYEPVAYADASGDYLPDFEIRQVFEWPLIVDVKGPQLTAEETRDTRRRMMRVWSSEPRAGLAIWTAGVIERCATFPIMRLSEPAVLAVLRRCEGCNAGLIDRVVHGEIVVGRVCFTCEQLAA